MFGFKRKNYLKRTDFINSVDSNKICSKIMTSSEIKELLVKLETEISKYEFDADKNFIMNSRKKCLKRMIEERLQKDKGNANELVADSLFNFWEFVGDEYPGNIISDVQELGISIKEFDAMDKAYREKGIICSQEKDIILDMIRIMENYIDRE